MKKFILLFVLLASSLYSQDVKPNQTILNNLSSQLTQELQNLKLETENLQTDLINSKTKTEQLENSLQKSDLLLNQQKIELDQSQTRLTELSTSLMNINQQLIESSATIDRMKIQLKNESKTIFTLRSICVLFLAFKILRIIAGFLYPTFNTFMISTKIGQLIDIII